MPRVFFRQRDVAEMPFRRVPSGRHRQTIRCALVRLGIQMELEFRVEFGLAGLATEQCGQPEQQPAKSAHDECLLIPMV